MVISEELDKLVDRTNWDAGGAQNKNNELLKVKTTIMIGELKIA